VSYTLVHTPFISAGIVTGACYLVTFISTSTAQAVKISMIYYLSKTIFLVSKKNLIVVYRNKFRLEDLLHQNQFRSSSIDEGLAIIFSCLSIKNIVGVA
jgi:hypothetical protein